MIQTATTDDEPCTYPSSSTSLISDCGDFVSGPSVAICSCSDNNPDGVTSQGSQTFEMNVTSLPQVDRTLEYLKQLALMEVVSLKSSSLTLVLIL